MAKSLKGSTKASPPRKPTKKLSLYPLDLETALGAALRADPPKANSQNNRKNKTNEKK
jgi:hypothetical protein